VIRATLRSWDTNDFASSLSDRLGISRKRVHWAGTKDKRAVTTQLFSIEGIDPNAIPGAGDGGEDGTDPSSMDEAEIEVLGRLGRSIELGDLAGNEFEIRIADAERPENVGAITDALARFATGEQSGAEERDGQSDEPITVAVPNYFGQQRFGSRRPITHEVGLAIVRGEWREAVRIYVADDYESEPDSTQEARRAAGDCMADGDWVGALDAMPNRLGYERTLLHALERRAGGGSGDGSDDGVDQDDFRTALGDLPENLQRMFVHAAQSYAFNRILSERLEAGLPFHEPVTGDVVCFSDADAPAGLALPDTDRLQRVTADRVDTISRHCERGRAFVTAPLVGTETELGDGEPGEIERSVLSEIGLEPAEFDLPDPFGSTGTRRAISVRTELSVDGDEEPTFTFALPKGSYATVLLREYLKVDPVELG
jgi:tRNA pseudouridine13 synthase